MRPDRRAVPKIAIVVAGLIAALILPRLIYPVLALEILLWGLFAMSVDLLLGFAGLLSFGHAAFWGVGGYAAALLARAFQLPFPVAALAGTVAAALLAVPIGFLSIRRRGIYFAMVTLAFAQLVFYLTNEWRSLTGGENGVQGVPRLLPGFSVGKSLDFYYAALPMVLIGFFIAYRVVHSPFGHVLAAIRDNEPRAQSLGYATWRYKLLGFVLSGALAGLAGSLFALGHGFASLELLHWTTSGEAVLMTILGGIGTLWGGLVGAAVVLLVRDTLSTASEASGVVTGTIFLVIVLAFRRGVLGTLGERLTAVRDRRAAGRVVGAEGRTR
ncbi:MAG TPA: branched-chain amino acid ABC transporter permease [Candidatus Saccharimonadales bacterium]|nr:branched-chain amino acid ABC transporter permease [Candidatus Saccharimonadales bacterium]